MNKKFALFAFNGDPMCFVHVLLNALDMHQKKYDVKIIIEGGATKLVRDLADSSQPFAKMYKQAKDLGLIDCVCRACAHKMKSLDSAIEQNLRLADDMSGHPGMAPYIDDGYTIITF